VASRGGPVGAPVAFVPTMGSCTRVTWRCCGGAFAGGSAGSLVLSIFVNPTQFGPSEDLDRYPRDEAGDLAKAAACGVDVAFCPTDPAALYPNGTHTWVEVEGLDRHLCGASRPGHFRGVCTVVAKLWGLVRPDFGLFGEKDLPAAGDPSPHARGPEPGRRGRRAADRARGGRAGDVEPQRQPQGPQARQDALAISALSDGAAGRFAAGERSAPAARRTPRAALAPGRVDYASLVDADDLQPVAVVTRPALVAIAAFFGGVRLIDNCVLRP
jgi:pantoate--beta-alanine ligase